jgi:rhodanese-related sulfurtransferase
VILEARGKQPMIEGEELLSGKWCMDQIMHRFPAAHRALAETYRIDRRDGSGSTGYVPADTLASLATMHGIELDEAIACIMAAHNRAEALEVSAHETVELMQGQDLAVLDVREPRAFAMAHVPGSRCVDAALAEEIIQHWSRDTPIVLVCHHGMRSLDAAEYLLDQGFTKVKSLKGGVDAWSIDIDPSVPRY